jgi:3-dehydroquinate dehydratase type I
MEDLSLRICRSAHFDSLEMANEAFRSPRLFAELRFDLSNIPLKSIVDLEFPKKTIFTFRPKSENFHRRLIAYNSAIEKEVDFIDLDFETDIELFRNLKAKLQRSSTQLILSQHNYESTPDYMKLQENVLKAFDLGADIAKIISTPHSISDLDRIYSLYQRFDDLIAFGMGELGKESRAKILDLGAPFTYAAYSDKDLTAPGQMNFQQTEDLYHRLKSENR